MKLLVSAFLLAAASAGLAQNQAAGISSQKPDGPQATVLKPMAIDAWAASCPIQMTRASLAPAAGLLPVAPSNGGDPALDLQFRNASGKAVRSAAISAQLRVKTNIYALDATPITLQLQFAGAPNPDPGTVQLARVPLPEHVYSFGVVRVTLDQVMFADGSVWKAPAANVCRVGGEGTQRVEAR